MINFDTPGEWMSGHSVRHSAVCNSTTNSDLTVGASVRNVQLQASVLNSRRDLNQVTNASKSSNGKPVNVQPIVSNSSMTMDAEQSVNYDVSINQLNMNISTTANPLQGACSVPTSLNSSHGAYGTGRDINRTEEGFSVNMKPVDGVYIVSQEQRVSKLTSNNDNQINTSTNAVNGTMRSLKMADAQGEDGKSSTDITQSNVNDISSSSADDAVHSLGETDVTACNPSSKDSNQSEPSKYGMGQVQYLDSERRSGKSYSQPIGKFTSAVRDSMSSSKTADAQVEVICSTASTQSNMNDSTSISTDAVGDTDVTPCSPSNKDTNQIESNKCGEGKIQYLNGERRSAKSYSQRIEKITSAVKDSIGSSMSADVQADEVKSCIDVTQSNVGDFTLTSAYTVVCDLGKTDHVTLCNPGHLKDAIQIESNKCGKGKIQSLNGKKGPGRSSSQPTGKITSVVNNNMRSSKTAGVQVEKGKCSTDFNQPNASDYTSTLVDAAVCNPGVTVVTSCNPSNKDTIRSESNICGKGEIQHLSGERRSGKSSSQPIGRTATKNETKRAPVKKVNQQGNENPVVDSTSADLKSRKNLCSSPADVSRFLVERLRERETSIDKREKQLKSRENEIKDSIKQTSTTKRYAAKLESKVIDLETSLDLAKQRLRYLDSINLKQNLTSDKPILTNDKPILTSDEPILTSDKPILTSDKPILTNDKPILTNDKPILTSYKPISASNKPILTSEKPILTSNKSILTNDKPNLMNEKPKQALEETSTYAEGIPKGHTTLPHPPDSGCVIESIQGLPQQLHPSSSCCTTHDSQNSYCMHSCSEQRLFRLDLDLVRESVTRIENQLANLQQRLKDHDVRYLSPSPPVLWQAPHHLSQFYHGVSNPTGHHIPVVNQQFIPSHQPLHLNNPTSNNFFPNHPPPQYNNLFPNHPPPQYNYAMRSTVYPGSGSPNGNQCFGQPSGFDSGPPQRQHPLTSLQTNPIVSSAQQCSPQLLIPVQSQINSMNRLHHVQSQQPFQRHMQTNPSVLCTQQNNLKISTELLKQQQLEQHRQRLASHVQINPVVTSIQQSSSQIPVQNTNDPLKQHHLIHTNHLATNKQQNSPQSAVHIHNDSKQQQPVQQSQQQPNYTQTNTDVTSNQHNGLQTSVMSQSETSRHQQLVQQSQVKWSHMQTNPDVTSTHKNSLQTSLMNQRESSRHQQLVQQSQQLPRHMQTDTDVTITQKNSPQASMMRRSETSRHQQLVQHSQQQQRHMQTNTDVTSTQKNNFQTAVMSQSETSRHQQLVQQSQQQPSQTNPDVTSTHKNSLQTSLMNQRESSRHQQLVQQSQQIPRHMQTDTDVTITQKNSPQASMMRRSETSRHQQLVQHSQQQQRHMQTNTDVTSTQKNNYQTSVMSQSETSRHQQLVQQSQQQPSHMQTNTDVTSNQNNSLQTTMSRQSVRNTRQNRQQCNRLNVSRQSPADADKDWRNNRSNRASEHNAVHQQEIGHVRSAIGKTNYHDHPSEQHIRSRTFRRSIPPLNKQAEQMSHNQQPFLDSSRELKERWEKQGARPRNSR